jgi:hypothetical protein
MTNKSTMNPKSRNRGSQIICRQSKY